MVALGSIYETEAAEAGAPRGADLHYEATVKLRDLGAAGGTFVAVPKTIAGLRRADPHDDGSKVPVALPASFPSGGTLRLRGYGQRNAAGVAGDLYLKLRVERPQKGARIVWLLLGVAALAGAVAFGILWSSGSLA